jgi:hypothetical protein
MVADEQFDTEGSNYKTMAAHSSLMKMVTICPLCCYYYYYYHHRMILLEIEALLF